MSLSEKTGDNGRTHAKDLPRGSNAQSPGKCCALSKREREVLYYLATGLTVRETSWFMCLSAETMNTYKTTSDARAEFPQSRQPGSRGGAARIDSRWW